MKSYDSRYLVRRVLDSPDIPMKVRYTLKEAYDLMLSMTCKGCGEWYRECDC